MSDRALMREGLAISCGAKTTGAACGIRQFFNAHELDPLYFLYQELGYAVTFINGESFVGMVEQKDFYFATVAGIDNPCAAVDALFDGQPTARPNQPDTVFWQGNTNSSGDQFTPAWRQNLLDGGR